MRRASLRTKVAVLLLALTVALPWCAAAAPTPVPPDLLGRLWLVVTSLWGDIGCHIDPSGGCGGADVVEPPATPNGDAGCHLDPSGGCGGAGIVEPPATVNGDAGCHLDPHGGCGG